MFLKDKLIKILKKHYLSLKMVKYQRLLNQAGYHIIKADKPTDLTVKTKPERKISRLKVQKLKIIN